MFCENCGKPLEDGALFCAYCGAASDAAGGGSAAEGSESVNPGSSEKKRTVWRIGMIGVALLTILEFVLLLYPGLLIRKNTAAVTMPDMASGVYSAVPDAAGPDYIMKLDDGEPLAENQGAVMDDGIEYTLLNVWRCSYGDKDYVKAVFQIYNLWNDGVKMAAPDAFYASYTEGGGDAAAGQLLQIASKELPAEALEDPEFYSEVKTLGAGDMFNIWLLFPVSGSPETVDLLIFAGGESAPPTYHFRGTIRDALQADNLVYGVRTDAASGEPKDSVEDSVEDDVKDNAEDGADDSDGGVNMAAENPSLADFDWYLDDVRKNGIPSDAQRADPEQFASLAGEWKSFVFYDPDGVRDSCGQELANISIRQFDGAAILTYGYYFYYDSSGEGFDCAGDVSTFAGTFQSGMLYVTGAGNIKITEFYRIGDHEYALGSYYTPDGLEAELAMVRP